MYWYGILISVNEKYEIDFVTLRFSAGYNSMRKAFVGLHNIVEYYSYRYWVLVEGPCLANESILNLLFLNSLDMDTIHFHFHFFSAILVAQCCAWPRTALLTWTRIS